MDVCDCKHNICKGTVIWKYWLNFALQVNKKQTSKTLHLLKSGMPIIDNLLLINILSNTVYKNINVW